MEIFSTLVTNPGLHDKDPIRFYEGFTPVPLYISYGNGTKFEQEDEEKIGPKASLALRVFQSKYQQSKERGEILSAVSGLPGIQNINLFEFFTRMKKEMGLEKAIFFIGIDEIQSLYQTQKLISSYLFTLLVFFFSLYSHSTTILF